MMNKKTPKEKLIKLFKQNNGYLLSKQMPGSTFRYHLNKMIESGEVVKIRHSLYVMSSVATYDERELIASMIPEGVFCLFSAWDFHALTTTIPAEHHIALHRNTKSRLPDYPPVKLYLWSKKYYSQGIEKTQVNKSKIKIYGLERSVCDAVKFRNKIGNDIASEVLNSYIKRKDRNIDLLMKYAKNMRMEKIITTYLQAIL